MAKDYDQFIQDILIDFKKNNYLAAANIPNIDLYMDQVTTFMDDHLEIFKRKDEDKTLTKTMINNYSKCQLLPPTNRKKYSREHMLLLLIIFYLKPTLSIPDIQAIITPLQKTLMKDHPTLSLEQYYDTIFKNQLGRYDDLSLEIMKTVDMSKHLFEGQEDDELLSVIAAIYMLSLQASLQKHIAAQLIDTYLKPMLIAKDKEPKKEDRKEDKAPERERKEKPKKPKAAE